MSNKSKRRPPIPPRPQILNEQMRENLLRQLGDTPRILNREQSMFIVGALAANLERMLNNREQMPWVSASIDKRSDGFSLHVQIVEPTTDVEATVLT